EWELSKENVQPLRQGRVMSSLQEALAQQDSSSHTAVQLKKQEFESEIRFYSGDDPLDVWDRYIKWTEQTFPQGGKDGNLAAVLERAVKALNEQHQYYKDPRYLSLWLKFGNCCHEPLDLYSYLHSQEIGTTLALLYITWAEALEARGNFKKADLIFQEGLQRKAEPLDKLQSHHRQFQARVSRQALLALEKSPDGRDAGLLEIAEPQRSSLADLKGRGKKKVRAPISRVGDAVKATNPNRSVQPQTPLQLPNTPGFSVFDENSASGAEIPMLTAQSWAAPPAARAKENELSAGPWNSGRVRMPFLPQRPRSAPSLGVALPGPLPSFTPYVDEAAQPQMRTPCKIEPSINHVLSARKPEKEDPLQRVQHHQQDTQERTEMVMYCKDKVYAGVDEFSLEEIRAEIYRKKAKKKAEEEMQAIAQKKEEIQRKIEELEKKLKKKEDDKQQQPCEQVLSSQLSVTVVGLLKSPVKKLGRSSFSGKGNRGFSLPAMRRFVEISWSNMAHYQPVSAGRVEQTPLSACSQDLSSLSLSIFLVMGSKIPASIIHCLFCRDELNGIEALTEDAIVTGSYKNKPLCANPEDTCDFNRAAHLASTPFHGLGAQRVPAPAFSQSDLKDDSPESKSAPLHQETLVCEGAYSEALCVNKLSPIMEASLEDTRSSGSSVSGGSLSSVTQTSAIKYLRIPEKLELAQSLPAESAPDSGGLLWSAEQRKKLLEPVPESLAASPDFYLEPGALPAMEVEKDIELGHETYCIKWEYWSNEEYKMFFAVPANLFQLDAKGFAIKVYSQPVPWDFYITLELQRRLQADFDQSFSESCSCYLYRNGCAVVHRDINRFTLRDVIRGRKSITEEVIFLVVYNLLGVVEKLHKAEIVHGDLRPEVFFLGDRFVSLCECGGICDAFANEDMASALKVVDFSHSLDLRLQPRVSLCNSFPVSQTPHGQQLLAASSLPYQADLVGIADIVHLMLFGDHIQVYQENFIWKISQNLPKTVDSDFWSKLFGRILNADGKSTAPLLRELREEIGDMFDSCFQERL
ncbi:BUB1B kinase, partial [Tachuris rubrigastra]|nr:BUB1B kinase [Tachuris rubrigastra]